MKDKPKFQFNFDYMIRAMICILLAISIAFCNTPAEQTTKIAIEEQEAPNFFPVTNYIYGQIEAIKQAGINPIKIDSSNNKTDTSWLKIEDFTQAFQEFLEPNIDSSNLTHLFNESKFEDQTIDSYTFTYTAKPSLPDSMTLQRWDVYISPASNTIKRIFMVKKLSEQKELQLTWQSGQWCKTVVILTNAQGQQSVSSVQIIKWNFE